MTNTPPTVAWYAAGLVFEDLKMRGGLAAIAEINQRKAASLYEAIDESAFYSNPVQPDARSWMNVQFVLRDADMDQKFLAEADIAGLKNLKGHRSVGGMRASIYNAMPQDGVDALIDFMREFEKANG
jgi:phosphoserine aminotransferase